MKHNPLFDRPIGRYLPVIGFALAIGFMGCGGGGGAGDNGGSSGITAGGSTGGTGGTTGGNTGGSTGGTSGGTNGGTGGGTTGGSSGGSTGGTSGGTTGGTTGGSSGGSTGGGGGGIKEQLGLLTPGTWFRQRTRVVLNGMELESNFLNELGESVFDGAPCFRYRVQELNGQGDSFSYVQQQSDRSVLLLAQSSADQLDRVTSGQALLSPGKFYVGAEYTSEYTLASGIRRREHYRVLGRERTSVQAGTFDTWKLSVTGTSHEHGIDMRVEGTLWVVPSLNASARLSASVWVEGAGMEGTVETELLDYGSGRGPTQGRSQKAHPQSLESRIATWLTR